MKAVILAGGKGSRISEESQFRPKPLVEIGGKPILWHIMKLYAHYGVNEFIICCGYKGHQIKEYFVNYNNTQADHTYLLKDSSVIMQGKQPESFRVTLVDTGLNTLTAGRLKKVQPYLQGEESFFLTYGDGVSDVNIDELYRFHREQQKCVTITAYAQTERFGRLTLEDNQKGVKTFKEKGKADSGFINAGFMVMNSDIFGYLRDGSEMLEDGPFEAVSDAGQMAAYAHYGFWSPMDTKKEQIELESLWTSGNAPWKVWE